jgi:hypothetical protein
VSETTDPTEDDDRRPEGSRPGLAGPRLVVGLYVLLVLVTATAGFLIATFVEGLEPPRFLFLVPFPPTPLGFAAYGGLTLALVLGVPLALVVLVSRRIDDPA